MKPDILEVQPQQLKLTFEPEKQSSCSVHITNKTDHHAAFEFRASDPKKYRVQPNTGVIDPNSACELSVTMQAQKVVAPLDMMCRDTFLVQSTVVPAGTKEEDVTSNTFANEHGKAVEEKMLKVIIMPLTSQLVQRNGDRVLNNDLLQKHSHTKILTGPRWKGKGSEVKALANPISKSVFDLQSSLIKSNSQGILSGCSVLLASNPEQTDLLSQTCFGQPIITVDKDKQWFQFSFEEAFYLCFNLKCIKIAGSDHVIKTNNELWEYMTSRRVSFPKFFTAYSHLRVKNWVVRSGCQYGVDFVAYRHHPSLVHSEYGVLVLSQGNGNDRLRVWSDIQCTLRLCGSVAKTLLVLHVNKKDENASASCLDGYSVEEQTITRWSPECSAGK